MHASSLPRPFSALALPGLAPRAACITSADGVDIPGGFSQGQALFVLALNALEIDGDDAMQLMMAAPEPFTQAQALCGAEMLQLGFLDLRSTLADAMAPCALRGQLMRAWGGPERRPG